MIARNQHGEVVDLPDDPSYLSMFRCLGLEVVEASALGLTNEQLAAKINTWGMTEAEKIGKSLTAIAANPDADTIEEYEATVLSANPEVTLTKKDLQDIFVSKGVTDLTAP